MNRDLSCAPLERKVLQTIREYGLLEPGDDVTAALSGGADSAALLWLLRRLAPELGVSLRAAHFHHGLRGKEADRDEAFCRELCAAWEIPFVSGRGDVRARAAETGESLEEAARKLRYDFLLDAAPGKLATAHNADDNAETVLLHLLRGSGPRGLGGIPPKRGRLIRPLLCCTRAEIEELLSREGLPYVEDSSNAADDCLRNRLRHRVMPLLRAENPGFAETVGRTAALVRAEDDYLSRLAAEAAASCTAGEGWSCKALLGLDPVLRRRVLLGLLRELGLENPSLVHVEALEAALGAKPSAVLPLPGGFTARREYDRLLLSAAEPLPPLPETALTLPGVTELPGGLGRIVCTVTKNLNFCKKKPTTFVWKYDMICGHELKLRSRRPGDRLTLSGGTKRLKALMIDRKLPARLRDAVPVLTLDGSPAAVFRVGGDPALNAENDDEALVITWETTLFPDS